MAYEVLYYDYQFKTKSDEIWDTQRVKDEFLKQTDFDISYSETFDNVEDAEKSIEEYMANRMLAPYIEKANIGYVVRGEVVELLEWLDEDGVGSSCIYTKGMEDKGAE